MFLGNNYRTGTITPDQSMYNSEASNTKERLLAVRSSKTSDGVVLYSDCGGRKWLGHGGKLWIDLYKMANAKKLIKCFNGWQ